VTDNDVPFSTLDDQATRILDAAEKILDETNGPLDPTVGAFVHAVLYGLRHVSYNRSNLRIGDEALHAIHVRADALVPRIERAT
jgi:hypothetical protein